MKIQNPLNMKFIAIAALTLGASALKADEKDLYDFMWLDPDKKVYVLQNKVHTKDKSIYLNVGLGTGLSSNFQDTSALHANFGFYLTEEWAIEGLYTKYSNKDDEAMENLKRLNGSIPFIRKTESNYAVLAKWSPFYGKINTFNKIFYFDWSIAAGVGVIKTSSNSKTVSNTTIANNYDDESYTSFVAKTGLNFHATKNIHVGVDLIFNNYKAPGPVVSGNSKDKIRTNTDAVFTLGISF